MNLKEVIKNKQFGVYRVNELSILIVTESTYDEEKNVIVELYQRKDTDHGFYPEVGVYYRNELKQFIKKITDDLTVIELGNPKNYWNYKNINITTYKTTGLWVRDNNEYEDETIELFPKDVQTIKNVQNKEGTKIIKKFGYNQCFQIVVINGILNVRSTNNSYTQPVLFGKNRLEFDYKDKNEVKHMIFLLDIKIKKELDKVLLKRNLKKF